MAFGAVVGLLALVPVNTVAAEPPGHIGQIRATFIPSDRATDYTVTNFTGFRAPVTATWTLTIECVDAGCPDNTGTLALPRPEDDPGCDNNGVGTRAPYVRQLTGGTTPDFVWHHPSAEQDPTGTYHCDHAKEGPHGHQGVIMVTVQDALTKCTAMYLGTVSSPPGGTGLEHCAPANIPPTAKFNYALDREADRTVTALFDGTPSSDPDDSIVEYFWVIEHVAAGQPAATLHGPTPSFNFKQAGYYTVELTVIDDRGATDTVKTYVKVERPPPGVATKPHDSVLGVSESDKAAADSFSRDLGEVGTATATSALGFAVVGFVPVAAVMGGISAGLVTVGGALAYVASDPPDSHYRQLVTPHFPAVVRVNAGGGLSRTAARALDTLSANTSRIAGYTNAVATSLNRASTALAAKDPADATAQLQAMAGFATKAASAIDAQAGRRRSAADALPRRGVDLSATEVARLRNGVKAHGLPAELVRLLKRAGVSAADRTALRERILHAKPVAVHLAAALRSAKLTSAERATADALRRLADRWAR